MQKSKTQIGLLGFIEKFVRKFVIIYYIVRNIAIKFNIFEEDFKILKEIFNHKKINIIDIGASDGISANFFLKNLNVKNIYCYEPHALFIKKHEEAMELFQTTIDDKIKNYDIHLIDKQFFKKFYYPPIFVQGDHVSEIDMVKNINDQRTHLYGLKMNKTKSGSKKTKKKSK